MSLNFELHNMPKNMKYILTLIILLPTLFTAGCSSDNNLNQAENYVLSRYNGDFIFERINNDEKDTIYEYKVSDKINGIDFIVGQRYSDKTNGGLSTILPPFIRYKEMYDTLPETIKEYVLKQNKDKIPIKISEYDDIDTAIYTVKDIMSEIDDVFNQYGIEVTKYSSSITLQVMYGDNISSIKFYASDTDIIKNLLHENYFKQ